VIGSQCWAAERQGSLGFLIPTRIRKKVLYRITPKGKTTLIDLAETHKERFEKLHFLKVTEDAGR